MFQEQSAVSFPPAVLQSTSYKSLRTAYDIVQAEILSDSSLKKCPPFEAVAYAIKNVLRPTFLLSEIPDLLILLAYTELLCKGLQKVGRRLDESLEHNLRYENRELVDRIQYRDPRIRTALRWVVNKLAGLDIHTILRGYTLGVKKQDLVKAGQHLELYFSECLGSSRPNPGGDFEWACLYHFGPSLTEDEKRDLSIEAEKATDLVMAFTEWFETRHRAKGFKSSSASIAFDASFPSRVETSELAATIEWYLTEVEKIVKLAGHDENVQNDGNSGTEVAGPIA